VTFRELGLVVVDDGGVLAAVFVCGVFNASELAASSIKMMIAIIYAIRVVCVYRVGFGVASRPRLRALRVIICCVCCMCCLHMCLVTRCII